MGVFEDLYGPEPDPPRNLSQEQFHQQALPNMPPRQEPLHHWRSLNPGRNQTDYEFNEEMAKRTGDYDPGPNAPASHKAEFESILRRGRPSIRIPEDVTPALAQSGRFMSQHETGTSMGMNDPAYRRQDESRMFGYPGLYEPHTNKAPIYGYIDEPGDPHGGRSVQGYGGVKAVLKPDVLHRTTATFGDSLGHNFTPVHVTKAVEEGVTPGQAATTGRGAPYVEAQFHGGLNTSDIDHLEHTLGSHMSGSLAEHAADLGKPYRILQKETYTQEPMAPATPHLQPHEFWRPWARANDRHYRGSNIDTGPQPMVGQQFKEIERSPGFKSRYWL